MANIFSMRIIGNKTHGDLAEIALTEYINEFVGGYTAKHTGKETFRAKVNEEDIRVINETTGEELPISIKTYGVGPLQLSTNKDSSMFRCLTEVVGKKRLTDSKKTVEILSGPCFVDFDEVNVLPLIYNEKEKTFKIIIFNLLRAYKSVGKIRFFPPRKYGKNKKTHPIYKFFDKNNQYIFEVRYGDTKANALQRGMWTHTENAKPFFNEILSGSYEINKPLLKLISKILVSPKEKHKEILKLFREVNSTTA
ncbi:hypothetical protein L6259_03795 [Candidatus Parcubacteria bacterium]|nr:hypothetical protein [Candidatus Parcubacteria bacterium]